MKNKEGTQNWDTCSWERYSTFSTCSLATIYSFSNNVWSVLVQKNIWNIRICWYLFCSYSLFFVTSIVVFLYLNCTWLRFLHDQIGFSFKDFIVCCIHCVFYCLSSLIHYIPCCFEFYIFGLCWFNSTSPCGL